MAKALNVNVAVTADTSQAKAELQQLQATLQSLTNNTSNLKVNLDTSQISKATSMIDELSVHLKKATNSQTGTLDFSKLQASLSSNQRSLTDYGNQLLKLGPQGQQAFAQLTQAVAKSEVPMNRMKGLLGEFGTVLTNTIRWQAASSAIHGMMGSIQHAFSYAQSLNESLNKIQIVTNASDASMAKFADSANKAAQRLNTTTTAYTDASLIYYQQGLSDKEVAERTEVTIKMANAAGVSAQKVSDQMTAVWNNFDDGSHSLEYYADVMTALGAATASSTDEISTGLQKFASVADTVGLSYENAAAALATITATTRQSADSVGTGLRTLFSRLQSLNLGETLDDGVTLTKYTKALETIGVNALDATGNLRSMDDILEDMGSKWNTLNDAQKTAVAQTVGGVRQYTTLIALMDNFDFYKQNQQVALQSEGTVQKQADIYAKSWEASQKRVKAAAESIYSDLINDDFFIGLNDGFANTLSFIDTIIDKIGGLKALLPGIAGLLTNLFNGQMTNKLIDIGNAFRELTQSPASLEKARTSWLNQASQQMLGITDSKNINETQAEQLNYAKKYLDIQAAYGKHQSAMSADDKQLAQMAMDRFNNTRQALTAQYQKIANDPANIRQAQGKMYQQLVGNQMAQYERWGKYLTGPKSATLSKSDMDALQALPDAQFNKYFDKNTGEFQKNNFLEDYNKSLDEFTQKIDKLENGKNVFQDMFDKGTASSEKFQKAMQDAGIEDKGEWQSGFLSASKDEQQAALEGILNELETNQSSAIANLANQWGVSQQAVERYADAIKQAKGNKQELANIQKQILEDEKQAATLANKQNKQVQTAQNIVNTAQALMSFTSVANTASSATSQIISDFQQGSVSASTFGTAITSLSSMTLMAMTGFKALSTVIGGPWAAVIAIASAVIPMIISAVNALDAETDSEKLERLNQEADEAKQHATDAKVAYDTLLQNKESHNELLNTLNSLTEGTQEFRDALLEANDVAQEIIKLNQLQYGKDWFYDERGAIQFQEGVLDSAVEKAAEQRRITSEMSDMATAYAEAQKIKTEYSDRIDQMGAELNKRASNQGYMDWEDSLSEDDAQRIAAQKMKIINQAQQRGEYLQSFDDATMFAMLRDRYKDYNNWLAAGNSGNIQDWFANSGQIGAFNSSELNELMSIYFGQSFDEFYANANAASETAAAQLSNSLSSLFGQFTARFGNSSNDYINGQLVDEFSKKFGGNPEALEQLIPEEVLNSLDSFSGSLADMQDYYQQITGMTFDLTDNAETDKKNMAKGIKQWIMHENLWKQFSARQKQYLEALGTDFDNIEDLTGEQINNINTNGRKLDEAQQQLWDHTKESYVNRYMNDAANLASQYSRLNDFANDKKLNSDDIFKNFSQKDVSNIFGITSKFESGYGKELARSINQDLIDEVISGDRTLQNALSKIAITGDAIYDIKSIRNSSKELGEEAAETIEAGIKKAKGGRKGLFEDLYKSEDFKDDLKSLQKQFKKTGKIGADAILDIANESEYLTDMLDESDISAQALADTLEMLEVGDIGIDEITDSLLAALTAAGAVDQTLAEVFSHIDNFQQERSTQDIGKFYKNLTGSVKSAWESGQIMDPQALQAWGELFGSDSLANYRQFMAQITNDNNLTPKQIEEAVQSRFQNEIAAMQSIQKYGDLSGMFQYLAGSDNSYTATGKNGQQVELFHTNAEGQVVAANANVLRENGWNSQQAFIEALKEGGISEDMAKAMAAEYAATNANINQLWRQTAAQEGIKELIGTTSLEEWKPGRTKEVGHTVGDGITTSKELEAFYNQYKDALVDDDGNALYKDFSDFLSQMQTQAKATGQAIVSLGKDFDYTKQDLKYLNDELEKTGSGTLQEYLDKVVPKGSNGNAKNIDDLTNAFERLGYTTSQAYDMIDQLIQESSSANIADYFGIEEGTQQWDRLQEYLNNNKLKLENMTAEDWADFYNGDAAAQQMEQQADMIANSMKTALTDLFNSLEFKDGQFKIKPEIDTGNMDPPPEVPVDGELNTDQLEDAVSETELEVPITPEESAVTEALAELQQKQNELEQASNEMTQNLQQQLDNYLQEASKSLEEYKQLQTEAIDQAKKGLTEEAQAIQEQAEAALQQAQDAISKAEAIQSHLEGLQTEITNQATNLKDAINQGKLSVDEAASNAINKYADAASTAMEQANNSVVEALKAASEGNIESMNSLLSQAESAAARAEAAASAALGAALISQSGGEIKGPSEGMTPEQQQQHYQMANVLGQYAAGGYDNLNGWDYNRWNNAQGGTMPSWAEISNWATNYAPGTMNAWDADASRQSLANIATAVQNVNNAIETSTQVQSEIATNTATTAEAAENGKDTTTPSDKVVNRKGDGTSIAASGSNTPFEGTGSKEDVPGYMKTGFWYRGEHADQSSKSEISGLGESITEGLKTAAESLKTSATPETSSDSGSKTSNQKVKAEASLEKVDVKTKAEVPVEAKNPEQITKDVEAETSKNPPELQADATVTVTEMKDDIEVEDQEATVDYDKGNQEEPEDEEAKVNYIRGSQQRPIDMTATVNYVKGSQEPPSDMTATVNYVNGGGGGGAGCFVAGTQILLPNHMSKNIEDIEVGEYVIAYNEQTKQFEPHKVVKTFKHPNFYNRTYKIYFTDSVILHLTPEHPLLSVNGWKSMHGNIIKLDPHKNLAISKIAIGDEILGFNTNRIIQNFEFIYDNISRTVYNLEVETCHTYIANGMVVHNLKASGYNNENGAFASGYGGYHLAGAYQGLATVGELGPELMIHGNQAFLVGVNGRTTAYVHPDDTIYTAAETQKIMAQNPTMQDLPGFAGGYRWPGFSVGYSRISWGSTSPGSGSSKAPKAGAKQRSKDFDPERYHYQTRVIADLNRYLERMNKLKDHAYGSHRIRAIKNEITATEDLIKANEKLLDEANKYLEQDKKSAEALGAKFDDEGNITNWDELQEKYARPAAEDSENEEAKKNWKLIQQYEETVDKIHETVAEIDDLRWSLSDLVNEEIEAKVDVKIDMDDRELDLLDYYLDKIKDNIDKTKDAIGIVNGELNVYTDEISTYQKVMDDLLRNARNAQGDKIEGLTLNKWMSMTPQERDALDIDYDLGKKLEEYSEEILDAMKKIQDLKLYAIDALNNAFEELNGNIQESTELFDHYGNLLESLKDISDLQGTIMNKDLQKAIDSLNKSMIANTKNSIKAQQDYYKELSENAKILQDQINNAQDWQVKEALQEQLDNIQTLMRDAEENILGLWQDGLNKAKEMFDFAIENITKDYEKAIAGAYANVDGLKDAYERQKTVNEEYVDDYERMYQLSKLQRNINRDLDTAAVNGNRHNKNLKALLTEIKDLQASGQQMSEYDLQLLEKRYEYEKALADLEDARNAKQTVRLQRDRNGNWGYVYSAADDEDLAKQEQAVEDKLHEWQQFEMESIDTFSSQLFDLQTEYGEKLSKIMSATWDSDEDRDAAIANLDAWYNERLTYLNKYLNTAFEDANSTIDRAKKRYQTDSFEIIDTFSETTLGMVNNTVATTEDLIANLQAAMDNMKTAAQEALETYSKTIAEFNTLVEESNTLFAEYANGQATSITNLSNEQLEIVQGNINEMAEKLRTGNDAMLKQVEDFNKKYYEKFNDPETGIITTNEKFLNQLQTILNYLNRIDYAVDSGSTIQQETGTIAGFNSTRNTAQSVARFDSGGYTGSWGSYGRFAILDQKEQVFNENDTKNLLDAANILRALDIQSGLLSRGLGDFFAPYVKDLGQTIEQEVHITADFPNVTNRTEIEEAFDNLVNRATQYANRKVG